ncbi:MAG: aldehyde dehydrogenase [Pseudomonadota bacterium]
MTASALEEIKAYPVDKFYWNGAWQTPLGTGSFDIVSPVTEETLLSMPQAAEADMDAAVASARTAFDQGPWPTLKPAERAEILTRFAALIREKGDLLARVWTMQAGTLPGMAGNSAGYSVSAIDRNVALADSYPFIEVFDQYDDFRAIVREPVGVVAAIAPWNAPLATMLNKIGPALMAGCPVIMKPAPETPLEAYIVAACADEAGFPPGAVNLIGAGREVSDYLVRHPGVDKVSFTGSVAAGKRIASVCGDRIARVTLELGGKSAAIICEDADLEQAAKSLAGNIVMLSGQNCAALTRALVPATLQDIFLGHLSAELDTVKVGPPEEEGVRLGPLAMKRQLERVEDYIRIGQAEGARLAYGGTPPEHINQGYYIRPTVFADVTNDMRIAQEEIFGPVLSVIPYETEAEAIAMANASDFGLAGGVYTSDVQKAYDISRKMRTGTVGNNGAKADFSVAFGGFKQSGLGREGGTVGIEPYLEVKTLLFDEAPPNL